MSLVLVSLLWACHVAETPPAATPPAPSPPAAEPALVDETKAAVSEAPTPAEETKVDVSAAADPLSQKIKAEQQSLGPRFSAVSNITVPSDDYQVHGPNYGSDWNVYPADNAVVLQGTVQGPIGDEEDIMVWLTGSVPDDAPDSTTRLELAVVFMEEENDYFVVPVPSSRDGAGRAVLLGVSSMAVRDTDGDGQTEVVAEARFRPCCGSKEPDFSETIVLHIASRTVTPSYPDQTSAKP